MTFRLRHLLAALALHGLLFGLLVSGLQCTRQPVRPPVIQAVLLDPDRKASAQQKRAEAQRLAEQRRQAEQERKRLDAEARRKVEQEQARREAEARKKQRAEEVQRRKAADAQRQKELAERKKAEEVARRKKEQDDKREAQEQARRELQEKARMEQAMQQETIQREANREQEARVASERERQQAQWRDVLERHVQKYWLRPASAPERFECRVRVQQLPDGTVLSANVERTCGNSSLDKSVEDAVLRASPLPRPADPGIFDRELIITFVPRL